jgi:hypothetical protein
MERRKNYRIGFRVQGIGDRDEIGRQEKKADKSEAGKNPS